MEQGELPVPTVAIQLISPLCSSNVDQLDVQAIVTYGGTNPDFVWFLNGSETASRESPTIYSISIGDVISVEMISNDACVGSNNTATAELTVGFSAPAEIEFTQHPQDVNVVFLDNPTITFSVAATGEGLTYQWQYYYAQDDEWFDGLGDLSSSPVQGEGTSTVIITNPRDNINGRKVRCLVGTADGCPLSSDEATINMGYGTIAITNTSNDKTVEGSLPWAVEQTIYFRANTAGVILDASAISGTIDLSETLRIRAGVTLKGPGSDLLTITGTSGISSIINNTKTWYNEVSSMTIEGVTISGGTTSGISTVDGLTLKNVKIKNTTYGIYLTGGELLSENLAVENSSLQAAFLSCNTCDGQEVLLHNSSFYNSKQGLYLGTNHNVTIENCLFKDNTEAGLFQNFSGGTIITGSSFISNRDGIEVRNSSLTINSSTISSNTRGGIDMSEDDYNFNVVINSSTIVRNQYGIMQGEAQSIPEINNTIIVGNTDYDIFGFVNSSVGYLVYENVYRANHLTGITANHIIAPIEDLIDENLSTSGILMYHEPLSCSDIVDGGFTDLTADQLGNPIVGVPDIGAIELQSGLQPLVVSATINQQSTDFCPGEATTFTAVPINGGDAPTFQWKINGEDVGTNSTTFTTSVLQEGDEVTVAVTSNATCQLAANPGESDPLAVSFSGLPTITQHPESKNISTADQAIFTANATGTDLTYQWQENSGSGLVDLTDGGIYSGVTTNTLTISGADLDQSGNEYRAKVTEYCPAYSDLATLSVQLVFVVNTLNDVIDANDGLTSLREAMAGIQGSTYWIRNGNITEDNPILIDVSGISGDMVLTSSLPDIYTNLKIIGPSDHSLTITTTPDAGSFEFIKIGNQNLEGGAIIDHLVFKTANTHTIRLSGTGSLKLLNTTISEGARVPIIAQVGTVDIYLENCSIIGNTETGGNSSAVYITTSGGRFEAVNTLFADNFSTYNAVLQINQAEAILTNCTISGNVGENNGAMLLLDGTKQNKIMHSTIVHNTYGNGYGIKFSTRYPDYAITQEQYFEGNVIAGNTGMNIQLEPTSQLAGSYNIFSDLDNQQGSNFGTNNIFNIPVDELVLPDLADNGGSTLTHALTACSPAINFLSNPTNNTPELDATGNARVDAADAGAVEFTGTIDTSTPLEIVNLTSSKSTVCDTDQITFTVEENGAFINYSWYLNDALQENEKGRTFTSSITGGDKVRVDVLTNQTCVVANLVTTAVTINEAPLSEITTQPVDVSVPTGGGFSLPVIATGTNLRYQWQNLVGDEFKDLGTDNISGDEIEYTGQTSSELLISRYELQPTTNYYTTFRCVITNDAGCSIISDVVRVTLSTPGIVSNLNPSGPGSFRQACLDSEYAVWLGISNYNDVFVVDATGVTGKITLTEALPNKYVSSHLVINGPSDGVLELSKNEEDDFRFFYPQQGDILEINNLTISNGKNDSNGGAIYQLQGTLIIDNCRFVNNTSYSGGAISSVVSGNNGLLTIRNSVFLGNNANNGGAIWSSNTTDGIIENCFFKNNNSSGLGAAIHVTNNSSLILSNLTLTENSGKNAAIEIINATAIMSSLTIANNQTLGIRTYNPNASSLSNSIVIGNVAGSRSADLDGTLGSQYGHNIIGASKNSSLQQLLTGVTDGNIYGLNFNQVLEGRLCTFEGSSLYGLKSGPCSPAVNAGAEAMGTTTDQWGQTRFGLPDIGAVEYIGDGGAAPSDLTAALLVDGLPYLSDESSSSQTFSVITNIESSNESVYDWEHFDENGTLKSTTSTTVPTLTIDNVALDDIMKVKVTTSATPCLNNSSVYSNTFLCRKGLWLKNGYGITEFSPVGSSLGDLELNSEIPGFHDLYPAYYSKLTLVSGPGDDDNALFEIKNSQIEEGDKELLTKTILYYDVQKDYSVRIKAVNQDGETTIEDRVTFSIEKADRYNPIFLTDPVAEAFVGELYEYEPVAIDYNDAPLTYSEYEMPDWMSLTELPAGFVEIAEYPIPLDFVIGQDGFYYINNVINIVKANLDGSVFEEILEEGAVTQINRLIILDNGDFIIDDAGTIKKVYNGTITTIASLSYEFMEYHPDGYIVYLAQDENSTQELKKMDLLGNISTIVAGVSNSANGFGVSPSGDIMMLTSLSTIGIFDLDGTISKTIGIDKELYDTSDEGGVYTFDDFLYDSYEEHLYIEYTYADAEGALYEKSLMRKTSDGTETVLWENEAPKTLYSSDGTPVPPSYNQTHKIYAYAIDQQNQLIASFVTIDDSNTESSVRTYKEARPLLSGTPGITDVGEFEVEIEVTNGDTYPNGYLITENQYWDLVINKKNEAPSDIILSSSMITENTGVRALVGAFAIEDSDNPLGDTHSIALVSGEGDTDNSSFNIESGDQLVALENFDTEVQSEYSIRMRATDIEGLTFEKAFTISVVKPNSEPTDITIDVTTIDENVAVGTLIGNITTTDPNVGDIHTYEVLTMLPFGGNMYAPVSVMDGKVYTALPVDFEELPSLNVAFRSIDPDGLSVTKTITFTVIDENEEPTDIVMDNTSVDEEVPIGTFIGNISTTDQDFEDSHTYEVLTLLPVDLSGVLYEPVTITEGKVYTAVPVDYELATSVTIEIRSTDAAGLSVTKSIVFDIIDLSIVNTGSEDVDWNDPDSWEDGQLPDENTDVILPSDFTIVIDKIQKVRNLQVKANTKVEITNGGALAIYGEYSGEGEVEQTRKITGTSSGGYSIVGSPMTITPDVSTLPVVVYEYDVNNGFLAKSSGSLEPGRGYFLREALPDGIPLDLALGGVPNTGDVTVSVTSDGDTYNLLSNPYTAAISVVDFIDNNPDIDGTLYLWDDGGANTGAARGGDYIAVNKMGLAGIFNRGGPSGSTGSGVFDMNIGSLQGFFAGALNNGEVTFSQSMQVTTSASNAVFFRLDRKSPRNLPQTIKLKLSNGELSNIILLGLANEASLANDRGYDSEKFVGNGDIAFYSMRDEAKYAIEGIGMIEAGEQASFNLGFDLTTQDNYTLSLMETMNMPDNMDIFIVDKLTQKEYLLSENPHVNFTTVQGKEIDRFTVVFRLSDTALDKKQMIETFSLYGNTQLLNLSYPSDQEEEVTIVDLQGREVSSQSVPFQNGKANLKVQLKPMHVYLITIRNESIKFLIKD